MQNKKSNFGVKLLAGTIIGIGLAANYVSGVIKGVDDETNKRCGFKNPGDGIDFHHKCQEVSKRVLSLTSLKGDK